MGTVLSCAEQSRSWASQLHRFWGSLTWKWFCPTLNQSCFTCSWLESSFRSWAVSRLSLSTLTPANEPMCSIDAEPAEFLLRAWRLPLPPHRGTLPRGLSLLCHLLVPLSPPTKSYKSLELKAEPRQWNFLVQLWKRPFFFLLFFPDPGSNSWLTWSVLSTAFMSCTFINKVKRKSEYKALSTLLQEADAWEWWWQGCHQGQCYQRCGRTMAVGSRWCVLSGWQSSAGSKLALLRQIARQTETQIAGFKMRSSKCTMNWEKDPQVVLKPVNDRG